MDEHENEHKVDERETVHDQLTKMLDLSHEAADIAFSLLRDLKSVELDDSPEAEPVDDASETLCEMEESLQRIMGQCCRLLDVASELDEAVQS